MIISARPVLALAAGAFVLSACLGNDGQPMPKTTDGAVIGGILGGIFGATHGGKPKNVLLGTAVGAAVGGLIGQELDRQEQALRAGLSNSEVGIVNTGKELVVTLPEAITFETDSSELRASLRGDLLVLAENLNEFPKTTVDIVGHTDNVGDAGYNQQLSAQRAESVYLILLDGSVERARMRAIGRGENEPRASNLTKKGRAQNRRVEIIIRPVAQS
ncbi:MAG: OmpA family protein [Paracoccaceae bacterium]